MNDSKQEVSWGTILKGAAIAAAAVAVVAAFPASLGVVGAFIADNALLTIGGAAVAGGVAAKQMAQNPGPRNVIGEQIDRESHVTQLETQRMEALLNARMQAVGMATGQISRS